jgi:hypothetical protein
MLVVWRVPLRMQEHPIPLGRQQIEFKPGAWNLWMIALL